MMTETVAGGGSWRKRGAGRRQRVGARAKGLYFSYTLAEQWYSPCRLTAKVWRRSIPLSFGARASARGGLSCALCLRLQRESSVRTWGWTAGGGARAVGMEGVDAAYAPIPGRGHGTTAQAPTSS